MLDAVSTTEKLPTIANQCNYEWHKELKFTELPQFSERYAHKLLLDVRVLLKLLKDYQILQFQRSKRNFSDLQFCAVRHPKVQCKMSVKDK